MMRAKELFYCDDGVYRSAGAYYCTVCNMIWRDHRDAEQCCEPRICNICNEVIPKNDYHKQCNELRHFNKAEKVAEWSGPVYCPQATENDGYFETLSDCREWIDDHDWEEGETRPNFVWTCDIDPFPGIDIDGALDSLAEQMWDDAREHFGGTTALYEAGQRFDELNKDLVTWTPNYTKAVLLIDEEVSPP